MDQRDWFTVSAFFARQTKRQLVGYLIDNGTIWPGRAEMLKWSKDELVSSATDRFLSFPANAGRTPAWTGGAS